MYCENAIVINKKTKSIYIYHSHKDETDENVFNKMNA